MRITVECCGSTVSFDTGDCHAEEAEPEFDPAPPSDPHGTTGGSTELAAVAEDSEGCRFGFGFSG